MAIAKSPVFKLNNGIEMPALGLGVFNSAPEVTVAAVSWAISSGYRLIDTGAAYKNEQQVPKSVRPERIAENIDIFDFALTAADVAAISARDTRARGGWDPDHVDLQTFGTIVQD